MRKEEKLAQRKMKERESRIEGLKSSKKWDGGREVKTKTERCRRIKTSSGKNCC